MTAINLQEKVKQACIEWSEGYVSIFKKSSNKDISDLTDIGVFSWSDRFIWYSTHCQINIVIPEGKFHTFAQAQEGFLLSIYTMLVQHTFQILESFEISAAEAALCIPNFFERHFDYFSTGIACQSDGWSDDSKDSALMHRWIGTRSTDFLANASNDIKPTDPKFIWEQGIAKHEKADLQGALIDFKLAVELDPMNPFFLNSLGTAEYESNNYENAELAFTQALEIAPDDPLILTNRARNRQLMFEEEEALKDIEKSLSLVPGNTTALYVRAQILISLERFEEAVNDLDEVIKESPDFAHALFMRARTLDEDLDCQEKALPDIEMAIGIEPDVDQYHVLHGDILLALDKSNEAIDAFNKALSINDQLPWALEQRSNAYRSIGNYEAAILDMTSLINQASIKDRFLEMRAEIFLEFGDLENSLTDINASITGKKVFHESSKYKIRSKVYRLLGEVEKSKEDHKLAYTLDLEKSADWISKYPNEGWPYAARAKARAQLGDKSDAEVDWLKAIELDPDSKNEYLKQMQSEISP